jgi:hypothetical protein
MEQRKYVHIILEYFNWRKLQQWLFGPFLHKPVTQFYCCTDLTCESNLLLHKLVNLILHKHRMAQVLGEL